MDLVLPTDISTIRRLRNASPSSTMDVTETQTTLLLGKIVRVIAEWAAVPTAVPLKGTNLVS